MTHLKGDEQESEGEKQKEKLGPQVVGPQSGWSSVG